MLSNAGAWSSIPATVLAHQGGWDEILLVVGPMLVVGGLLWLAKRRVTAQTASGQPTGDEPRPQQPGSPADQQDDGTRSIAAPTDRNRPTRSS